MKFKIKFIISQIIKLTFLTKLFLKTWKIKDNSIYYTKKFSLQSKYLLLPSIPCSKKIYSKDSLFHCSVSVQKNQTICLKEL